METAVQKGIDTSRRVWRYFQHSPRKVRLLWAPLMRFGLQLQLWHVGCVLAAAPLALDGLSVGLERMNPRYVDRFDS